MVGNILALKLIFLSMELVSTLLLPTLPNKMVYLKGDIATLLKLVLPYSPTLTCLFLIGPMHFKLLPILSITCLPLP